MGNVCECQRPETYITEANPPSKTERPTFNQGENQTGTPSSIVQLTEDDLDSDHDDDTDVFEHLPAPSAQQQAKSRQSVSAEAYGEWNKKSHFKPPVHSKTPEQKEKINSIVSSSFLFSSLDIEDIEVLLDAFEQINVKKGTTIIKQGDDGDKLYLIESGNVDVYKATEYEASKLVTNMHPGEAFGELALMYNAPRAATVIAAEDMVLWALDRETFSCIVKDAASKKRDMYEKALEEVHLLKDMDPYERSKVADALKTEVYEAGDVIIKEGDEGDTFYMVLEGEAEALKEGTVVMKYAKGGCFGELSLLKNQPRAATVKATTLCKVAYMDRRSFKRLLGPLEAVLMRNQDHYRAVMQDLGLDTQYLDK